MNILKKIVSLVLSVAILLGLIPSNIASNVYAEDNNQSNILEEIKNNEFLEITQFEFDSESQEVKLIRNIPKNSRALNLEDGKYLIYRGDGWVLGNDESFIQSGFAEPGAFLRIMKGKLSATQHNIMVGIGLELDFEVVKAAVEITYDYTIDNETNIMAGFEMTAPSNKSIYAKAYGTYKRYDTIIVKDQRLAGHSVTYEPNGTWLKHVMYNKGETVDQNSLKERFDRNIFGEDEMVDIKNSISVYGSDRIKNLDILLNSSDSNITITNRSKTQIHPGTGSGKYFSIELLDSNNKVKSSIVMTGNDYSSDPKFDSFDRIAYSIGDKIRIYHKEPFLLNVNGPVFGTPIKDSSVQTYVITEDGLQTISKDNAVLDEGIYNLASKTDPSYSLGRSYSGRGVVLAKDFDKNSSAAKWEFIYDHFKNAYKIRNVETNKYLARGYYSSAVPNALYAIDQPNDDSKYFKIEKFGDNEISIVNLETNLAIERNSNYIELNPYIKSDSQKFLFEKFN